MLDHGKGILKELCGYPPQKLRCWTSGRIRAGAYGFARCESVGRADFPFRVVRGVEQISIYGITE